MLLSILRTLSTPNTWSGNCIKFCASSNVVVVIPTVELAVVVVTPVLNDSLFPLVTFFQYHQNDVLESIE